MAKQVLGFNLM